MAPQTVTAHIARVDALAALQNRPCGWAVKQALADWVEVEKRRHQLTLEALENVHTGMGVPRHGMASWSQGLAADKPLPLPQARRIRRLYSGR